MPTEYAEVARRLGISPLQVLVEMAAMRQPWEECWPACDEGFEATIKEQRRVRLGLPLPSHRPDGRAVKQSAIAGQSLPVSEPAAAILNKLVAKSYGLKPVRVFTLINKWVHAATEADVRELVHRGYLAWANPERDAVNLVADRMAETEMIAEMYRRRQRSG
jgi:hypothetical protein